jgi:hypothetical protein
VKLNEREKNICVEWHERTNPSPIPFSVHLPVGNVSTKISYAILFFHLENDGAMVATMVVVAYMA